MPWLIAAACMVVFIWGNSLVSGEGSGHLSLAVLHAAHHVLKTVNLPHEWLTHFLVRKTAHFTEYAVLGFLLSHGLGLVKRQNKLTVLCVAACIVLVPSIDETIQLFTPGRSGMIQDVLLDICGATTGATITTLICKRTNRH